MSTTDTATVTNETTELVQLLREWAQKNHWDESRQQPKWTAAAMALGVSRPRFTNWYRGANGIDIQGHPDDHRAIAAALNLTMREAASLNGIDVSDTVPTPQAASVGDSPRWANRQNGATQIAPVYALPVPA